MPFKAKIVVQAQSNGAEIGSIEVVKESHAEIEAYVKYLVSNGFTVAYEKTEVNYVSDDTERQH